MILYELLTARVPFDAEAAVTVAIKHVSEAPVAPRTINPMIPAELEQITLWALNKNPVDRPADAEEFLRTLKHARAAITSGAVTERTAALSAIPAGGILAAAADSSAPAPHSSAVAEGSPTTVLASGGDGRQLAEEPPPPPPEQRRRRDLWLWLGLLALLIAAAAAAAVFLLTAPNQTGVPAVVGKQVRVATTTLRQAGFKVSVRRARSARAAGIVLNQNPASGSQANPGSTIHLTVSAGPQSVKVPDLRGKPLAEAEVLIRQARFKVGKVQQVTDTSVPAGDVSSTSPFAGEPEPPGTAINVFVSTGPPLKTVPSVTGQTEASARATLESAGFSVASSTTTTNSAPAGTVISQSPAGNAQATPGSTVSIVVAQKPPPPATATVPAVTGDAEAQARSAIGAAGFSVNVTTQTVTDKSKNGIVLSQNPSGGTKLKKGATVTIVVGNYKQPTTTTTTTGTTPTTKTTKTGPTNGPVRVQ